MEFHFKDPLFLENIGYPYCLIFRDFLSHLLTSNGNKPFISSSFIFWEENISYIGFSLLDLPLSISTLDKYPHQIDSDGNRGMIIKAGSEAILFKKEIKEGQYKIKKDLIITHKY